MATSQHQKRPVSVVTFGILLVWLGCHVGSACQLPRASHIGFHNLPRPPNVARLVLKNGVYAFSLFVFGYRLYLLYFYGGLRGLVVAVKSRSKAIKKPAGAGFYRF
ncbi:hypothetical protein [Photobacterium sp. GB-56]|uniref:hypothetical protein n=1 Tax=Photobacterium sp. GB-56 TaxID=2022106 RepID=UPI000D17F9FA|nr:hypothetical protein [Photobacterium sp. GB-56]PSV21481.1 hypothetical protein C9J42_20930 [Photobacterium sp. GB-56]